MPCPRTHQANFHACSPQPPRNAERQAGKLLIPFFLVFWYDSTRGLNPKSTDFEVDALTIMPLRRLWITMKKTRQNQSTAKTNQQPAPISIRLNVVVRSPAPFGLGRNGCWPSRGFQLSRALPFIFSLCCLLNDCSRAAHGFFKIGRLFSLFLFSSPSSSPHSSPSLDER